MRPPKDLSNQDRNKIVQYLLANLKNGKPRYGAMKEAASLFNTSQRTITRLWAAAKKQKENGQEIYLANAKPGATRKKRIQVDIELIQSLDLQKRSTIRRLAVGINQSKSTVWRWVNKGLIRAHSSAIKPDLTAPNKLLRLRFSLEALEFDHIMSAVKFKTMDNTIHVDEKWFYITKASNRFYLTPGEGDPHRTCKSKAFIKKVMFVCAVCRPVFSDSGECLFDGKIGIFPLIEQLPAKRNSKNRPAGTMETKPIQSVTKEIMKGCYINQLLPAIYQKWPEFGSKLIYIQQDNAKPHILDSDPEFRAAATAHGFNIRIVQQPPNSPDTNVNDLGWFRAIQSIQEEHACYSCDDLVKAVEASYAALSPHTLNKVFLSLQSCMVEIMKQRGHNAYKIPHMRKDALMRAGELPRDLEVSKNLVEECITYLTEHAPMNLVQQIMEKLGYPFADHGATEEGLINDFQQLEI
ncbi:uncharacterized protein LOC131007886 [Salvia miltiorrhiza]|uniref:uncharacterized protein LOC131007886 n=1 Tax=Salvia miltiorrhiza TaxID=226208 RepID=UPI0025AC2554|nr:uncharacterized protein LOC131007886 [Salvia miltiorrhiza]